MRIGEAAAAVGVAPVEGRDHCVCVWKDGRPVNVPLRDCLEREATADVYLASGTFRPGTLTRHGGRTAENLASILWLPFDADLADWLRFPEDAAGREAAVAEMRGWEQFVLDREVDRQRQDVEEVFARLGLPIHRLDYTGYGLCAYVRVAEGDAGEVGRLRSAHKALVSRINETAGFRLVDPQVSDAGTRITRLPPFPNTKGGEPRTPVTLASAAGAAGLAELEAPTNGTRKAPPSVLIPAHGKRLPDADAAAIADAFAPSWRLGQKHGMGLAVGGWFAKNGVPEEQAVAIVRGLAVEDQRPDDREKAVRDSYARVRSGLDVRGFLGLRDLIPAEALAFADARLGALRNATTGRLLIGGKPAPAADEAAKDEDAAWDERWALSYDDPPAAAFFGVAREYVDLMAPTSEAPDAFHLGAFLTLVGAMAGRRVRLLYASDDLYANLYTVLIGPSGSSRKDTAIKRALALSQLQLPPRLVMPVFNVSRDVSSAEGVVQMLKNQPNTVLYLTELSAMIANARRKSTSTILDRLIEAWDTPHVLQNLNKLSPVQAHNPYLSIVAATQPKRLATEMTDEDIHSGFANRWLYVVGAGKEPMARPPGVDRDAAWRLYVRLHDTIGGYPEGTVLSLADEAHERWDAWYRERTAESGKDEDRDAMRIRHAVLIQKIALVNAVANGAQTIGDDHLAAAMVLVDWMWGHVRSMLQTWGIGPDKEIEQRVVAVLRKFGAMKRWELSAKCSNRKWSSRDTAGVVKSMIENHILASDPSGVIAIRRE